MSNISYSGIKTIIFYEIKSFFKEYQYNIIAPLVNTLLFILIFTTIERYYSFGTANESYINFLIPGLIITVIIQTSFNHLSQIIIQMKQVGSFNDYLISPLTRIEIFLSFLFSSIVVCFVVAIINVVVLSFFGTFEINIFKFLYYLIICIVIFSSIGAITGFLSFAWDFQSAVSNFIIVPISFFSGSFFSVNSLDEQFKFIFFYNPIYYLVSGFRGSFLIKYEINFYNDLYLILITFIIFLISLFIFNKGYRVIN